MTSIVYSIDCSYLQDKEEDCEDLLSIDKNLVANMIYPNSFSPNYGEINNYNNYIAIDDSNLNKTNKTYIKNAWIKILRFYPEIYYNDQLYLSKETILYLDYNYSIELPKNYQSNKKENNKICKKTYSIENKDIVADNKITQLNLDKDDTITKSLSIKTKIKEKVYVWDKFCDEKKNGKCIDYDYKCELDETNYYEENLTLEDKQYYTYYNKPLSSNLELKGSYHNTTKYLFNNDNHSNTIIIFDNSTFINQNYEYKAFFKEPLNILTLEAIKRQNKESNNLVTNNNSIYIADSNKCKITNTNFFYKKENNCLENQTSIQTNEFKTTSFDKSLNLLILIGIFLGLNYLIFKFFKNKFSIVFLLLLFLTPISYAEDKVQECGIMNLGSCLPEKIFNYMMDVINAPIEPLIEKIKSFIEEPPAIFILKDIWTAMIYLISLFYGLLFIYSGFMFIVSGHDVVKREMAKEWFYNTIIMIVLVQASYYLYDLVLELGSVMTFSVLSITDETFFLVTVDNLANVGLEFFMYFIYVVVLLLTLIFLSLRYIILIYGVIIIPFGVFFYFIPPLRSYGKLIFNILGMFIFSGFFASLIILTSSKLLSVGIYSNIKILVMISCFLIIDLMFLFVFWHAISKSIIPDTANKFIAATKFLTPRSSMDTSYPKQTTNTQ